MPAGLTALLSGQTQPPAPAVAGEDGRDAAGGGALQSLLQQPGDGQQGSAPGIGPPAPNHEQTAAAVHHLAEFQRQWKRLMAVPGFGKQDIKGDVLEMMADVMGEQLVTLPQVMNELKGLPTDPLGQRQWVEEHYKKAEQASIMLLQHYAAANPRTGSEPPPNFDGNGGDHATMMKGLVDHYKQRGGR